eukprot:CAMPEP_0118958468 /NCGR_PEP_ID=MMETSP1169-20130426/62635_1 /TAXON_ID=36882 /ORGANISM="Pyramimonas obovata, Strain CCMP722" /LENGTH=438 /DNA_ID=CAMNT_0006906583 /DNA_START=344 /DNA_END=1660 /DNA_ORIENTATION=-
MRHSFEGDSPKRRRPDQGVNNQSFDPYGIGDQVTYVPYPNHTQPWFPPSSSSANGGALQPGGSQHYQTQPQPPPPPQGFHFHPTQEKSEQQAPSETGRSPCGGACTIPSQEQREWQYWQRQQLQQQAQQRQRQQQQRGNFMEQPAANTLQQDRRAHTAQSPLECGNIRSGYTAPRPSGAASTQQGRGDTSAEGSRAGSAPSASNDPTANNSVPRTDRLATSALASSPPSSSAGGPSNGSTPTSPSREPRAAPPPAPSAPAEARDVLIWDLDETLICFQSFLDGRFALTNAGAVHAKHSTAFPSEESVIRECVALGGGWENIILQVSDSYLFFEELEECEEMRADGLDHFDDHADLSGYQFEADALREGAPLDGMDVMRMTAYRLRRIRQLYQYQGHNLLSEEFERTRADLHGRTDQVTTGWLAHARRLTEAVQRARAV